MDDELKAALQGLEERLFAWTTQFGADAMARFDRMEDGLGSMDARLSVHATQLAGLTEQFVREQQLVSRVQALVDDMNARRDEAWPS